MDSQYTREATRLPRNPAPTEIDTLIEIGAIGDDEDDGAIADDEDEDALCNEMEARNNTLSVFGRPGEGDTRLLHDNDAQPEAPQTPKVSPHADWIGLGVGAGIVTFLLTLLYFQKQSSETTAISTQPGEDTNRDSFLHGPIASTTAPILSFISYFFILTFLRNRSGPYWFTGRPPYELDEDHTEDTEDTEDDQSEPQVTQFKAGVKTTLLSILQLGAQTHNTTVMPARFQETPRPYLPPTSQAISTSIPMTSMQPYTWLPGSANSTAARSIDNQMPPDNDISDDDLAEALEIIASIEIPDVRVYFAASDRTNHDAREKRQTAGAKLDNAGLIAAIKSVMLNNPAFPARMHQEMETLFNKTEKEVNRRTPKSQKGMILLITTIYTMTNMLDIYVSRKHSFKGSYHYLMLAIQQLWRLGVQVENTSDIKKFDHFKNAHKKILTLDHIGFTLESGKKIQDAHPISDYLQNRFAARFPLEMHSNYRIAFHSLTGAKSATFFSIKEMLENANAGCTFMEKAASEVFYHFEFDNSGIPDEELQDFIDAIPYQDFREFKTAYVKEQAAALLENEFKAIETTPLYFNKAAKIEELITSLALDTDNHLVDSELLISMIDLVTAEPHDDDPLVRLSLDSADVILGDIDPRYWGKINSEQVKLDDFIYAYTDNNGQRRYDTASLVEIMNSRSATISLAIAQRKNVEVLWPKEFSEELRAKLEEKIALMKKISEKFAIEITIQENRRQFAQHMPSFDAMLEDIHSTICTETAIHGYQLSDTIEFSYYYEDIPVGPIVSLPAKKMVFTAREILAGAQRAWRSNNYLRINEEITAFNGKPPTKAIANYVSLLQKADTQGHMKSVLEALKKDQSLHALYYAYIQALQKQVVGPVQWRYEFEGSPLIAVYFSKNPGLSRIIKKPGISRAPVSPFKHISRHTSLVVQSLISGKIHAFDSYPDMVKQIKNDPILRAHFAAHFDVDNDGLEELTLSMQSDIGACFNSVIDQQIRNVDKQVRSHTEAKIHTAAQIVFDFSFVVTLPTIGISFPGALIVGIISSAGPKIIQAAIADTSQERNIHVNDALYTALAEVCGAFIMHGLGTGLSRLIRKKAQHISVQQDLLDWPSLRLKKENASFSFSCPVRVKRTIGQRLCIFSFRKNKILPASAPVTADIFRNLVSKHNAQLVIKFNQIDDLLNPASKVPELARLNNLDEGMCLSLSLTMGNQILHGDVSGTKFLMAMKNIAQNSAPDIAPNLLKSKQISLINYLDKLHTHQPADFNQIKIRKLQEQLSAYDQKLALMEKSLLANPNSISSADVIPIMNEMNVLQKNIRLLQQNGSTDAWHEFERSIHQWASKNSLTSTYHDYALAGKTPGNNQLIGTFMKELKGVEDKAILITTNDHAMLLFHNNGRYGFFEPNFGVVEFDSMMNLRTFLTDLSFHPEYQFLPKATILAHTNPNGRTQAASMKKMPETEVQKILAQIS